MTAMPAGPQFSPDGRWWWDGANWQPVQQSARPPGQQHQQGVRPQLQAKGQNGTIVVDEHYVTIKRTGFVARTTVGKGEKRIPLGSITAVQWKKAGIVVGFIQFTIPGGNEVRSRVGSQSWDAGKDENSVTFTVKQQSAFEQIRAGVEASIAERLAQQQVPVQYAAPVAPVAAAPDYMAQLRQLAELRDAGVLSDEEFAAKKADLLARM